MTTSDKTNAGMNDPASMIGAQVHDDDGGKLGKVDTVYFDNATDKPAWAGVKSGLFGTHISLVPLDRATWNGTDLSVPFDKAALQNAPHHDPDVAISATDEQELYRHYGISADQQATPQAPSGKGNDQQRESGKRQGRSAQPGGPGRDTSGPNTDDAMTRSEERLHVGTEQHESGRARLRKYVVTENVTQTVPVRHEEVVLEREPITDANRGKATAGGDLTEEEHEVTLHEERVVTSKETTPVERVRLGKETRTDEQTVNETVRKERIDADGTDGVDLTQTGHGKNSPGTGKNNAR
ncbi:photosystem reaction center subunit H [Amycolatopsis antarctica]|uniref:Photosystem reaction center subunit H n=1 Tax=Amycolatopsis antarctica TaxID=1854586 RepID=A0A263D8B3_9PSEU|nr:PRC and DUF2382 domain-containing protein [Amycolatopsis antarctica]OZM74683.1 photosystem reaction center subunit H [Amycolatopsis antarctica]